MAISVTCPNCGKGLNVKAGKRGKCPGCGLFISAPSAPEPDAVTVSETDEGDRIADMRKGAAAFDDEASDMESANDELQYELDLEQQQPAPVARGISTEDAAASPEPLSPPSISSPSTPRSSVRPDIPVGLAVLAGLWIMVGALLIPLALLFAGHVRWIILVGAMVSLGGGIGVLLGWIFALKLMEVVVWLNIVFLFINLINTLIRVGGLGGWIIALRITISCISIPILWAISLYIKSNEVLLYCSVGDPDVSKPLSSTPASLSSPSASPSSALSGIPVMLAILATLWVLYGALSVPLSIFAFISTGNYIMLEWLLYGPIMFVGGISIFLRRAFALELMKVYIWIRIVRVVVFILAMWRFMDWIGFALVILFLIFYILIARAVLLHLKSYRVVAYCSK